MKHHILQSLIALLLLGVSQNAFAYNWSAGKTVYFDNAVTQWSAVYVIIGHGDYSRAYKMEAEPNTTLYQYTMSPTWEGYTEFVIASSIGKSSLDGGGVKITDAYSACTSRINGIKDEVTADILITVAGDPNKEGNTSIYSYTSTNTFDINKYNVPVVPKKATHLIIFNSNPPTRSAHLWSNTLSNHRYNAQILEEANGTTLSYFDNSTYDYHKSAPHIKEGEGGGWESADCNTFIGNVETERPDTFPDNVLYYRAATTPTNISTESFKTFTHLSATFDVSSTTAFINKQITLTAIPDPNATLYKDGGNSAEYAFYVKDAEGTISCISDFSTNASVTYKAPSTAQTLTLYCYVRDLYGLETIQYTKEIKVIDALPTPKTVSNLIIFNTYEATKSAWMWIDDGRDDQFETTVLKTVNGTTLSYYDNSVYQFAKAIPFKEAGTSDTWPNGVTRVVDKNIETNTPDSFPDRVLYFRAITHEGNSGNQPLERWSSFTHLSATFEVSSASPCTNEQITLTATPNKNATLYKDGGNSAEYAFYVKDAAGTISRIADFSTTPSVTYTAPSTAQTLTLYCYVRDLYGLETIQYTKTITINYCNTYYYYNKNNWETVKAYMWYGTNTIISANWPGSDMQAVAGHDRWYSITVRSTTKPEWIIFNNDSTKDISDDIPIHSDSSYIYYSSFEQHPSYDSDKGYSWYDGFISEINYDNNDGSGTTTKAYCQEGNTITLPTPAARTGYTFTDWYTEASGGSLVGAAGASYRPSNDITLYAHWTIAQGAYRLVYAEKDGERVVLFHPSHVIASAEPLQRDTLSMYVKPFERKNSGQNPHQCEVWLQQFVPSENGTMVWKTKQSLMIKDNSSTFPANGVYNFVLVQDGNDVSVPITEVHPYLGNYYIRLGLDATYRSDEKQFHFSDYASQYNEHFDHYFCKWAVKDKDICFTVACDYSDCLTDTLVQEPVDDPHHDYTDANGKLKHEANIRFMWNSENNHIDRAYIAGDKQSLHILSANDIYDMNKKENHDILLIDEENWVYQEDVYAQTGALVKLLAKPYNDAPKSEYLYLKGEAGEDFTKENAIQLINGTAGQGLKVRVIYDFKSDHLISAWLPETGTKITGELPLQSDLLLIRKEHSDAQQITFSNENASITKVSQAYGVVSLSRSHFADPNVPANAKKFYWISFPFDVHLSEVFSSLTYGSQYLIKYYDGAERAAKGYWIDSPTFWKMYTKRDGVVLKKGVGYLLHVNCNDTAKYFDKGNKTINIYFPSANTDSMTISGEIESITVPEHKCTIQRDHRYIYDSNWNLIGVPAWANVDTMGLPKATEIEGISVKFLYDYVPSTNGYNTVETSDYNFGSMKAYLVQFAGTIDWRNKSITPSQKPLRAPAAPAEKTVRLELLRGEEVLDHTFVQLSDAKGITEGFDLNNDLTKMPNEGCNLYSLIGSEQIEAAANILPFSEQTVYVPLGVSVDRDGAYTFALPKEMEGMDVRIADAETGYSHNLLLSPYEVALTAGTYTQRFSLEIHVSSQVTTGCQETDAAGNPLRKVLINGQLYILRDGKAYDAIGREL